MPLLGANSFCGSPEGALSPALREALVASGFGGEPARLDKARHIAYLEAHIEQGPKLEAARKRIGVVTGIVGIRRCRITARGQADHAGTTPMAMRKDAGATLLRLAAQILETLPKLGAADTVWNIGVVQVEPGAANVVPALASMVVEFRDLDATVLERMLAELRALVTAAGRGAVEVAIEVFASIEPAPMDKRLAAAIDQASRAEGEAPLTMPSGAGHDAMVLSRVVPSAMLFIPSIGGRSHDIAEDTAEDDIVLGCRVLARTVETIAA